jgi:signal transduction histidine kinase
VNAVPTFLTQNIVFVYFLYGLAFFAMGLVVILESARASEFRFARGLPALAAFGLLHGTHEWYEMFQIFAAHEGGRAAGTPEEVVRITLLAVSFLSLMAFGIRLLPDADRRPNLTAWRVAGVTGVYLAGIVLIGWRWRPSPADWLAAAEVLARYSLGIPSALLACWALLRERRDFHARGMSGYGQDLLWAALAFFVYGALSQLFSRASLLYPSQVLNSTLFLRVLGFPVQLLRSVAAVAIAVTLGRALRAFELESRLRLAQANQARLEAQAAALEAQRRRAEETEALNQQLRTSARELSALVAMSSILTSTVDLQRLLQDALYQMVHSFESAGCSAIFLKRPDGGLELAARYQRPEMAEPAMLPPLTRTTALAFKADNPAGGGLDDQVRILTADVARDDRPPANEGAIVRDGGVPATGVATTGAAPEDRRYRTLAVPLHAKEQLFGGVVLTSLQEDEPFGPAELRLLIAFGQQLAASVENAGLYQTLRLRETQLEELVRQLVNAQENERQRIARELHDETGQKLTALAMGLAAIETSLGSDVERAARLVRELRDLADQSITELRNVMSDLRPSQLDDLGLVPALRWYVQRYNARHPELTVTLTAERPPRRLPAQYETVLFRVAQEALSNVAKHASATQVSVQLCQEADFVRLEVVDNGVGFDSTLPRAGQTDGPGWGLVGIRERVALVAGKCSIESQRGGGARVRVELPLK